MCHKKEPDKRVRRGGLEGWEECLHTAVFISDRSNSWMTWNLQIFLFYLLKHTTQVFFLNIILFNSDSSFSFDSFLKLK